MTRSRFLDVLREQEAGRPTADVCRRRVLSNATFYG
jgi:hypothetical protein